jgi:hypothetical protein
VWLLGTVGDAGRCSAIAVPRWACRQPAMRNGNATGGNTGELALIPSMILSGLVLGRLWKVANVVGVVLWPAHLVFGGLIWGADVSAAAFGALNTAAAVPIHEAALSFDPPCSAGTEFLLSAREAQVFGSSPDPTGFTD